MESDGAKVSCYSGRTYAERPTSFQWQGIQYDVVKIEKEWLEPGMRFFQVKTSDNKTFRLCYNEGNKKWRLIK